MKKFYLFLFLLSLSVSSLWSQTLIVDPDNSPYTITGLETYSCIYINPGGVLVVESTGELTTDSLIITGNPTDSTAFCNKGITVVHKFQESSATNFSNEEGATYTLNGTLQPGKKDIYTNKGTMFVKNLYFNYSSSGSDFNNSGILNITNNLTWSAESILIGFYNGSTGIINVGGNVVLTGEMNEFTNSNTINVNGNITLTAEKYAIIFYSGSHLFCNGNITFNSPISIANNSYIQMNGNNTSYGGSSSQTLSNLILNAPNIYCNTSVTIADTLYLNNCKFTAYGNITVSNTSPNAIQRENGYVYSIGSLSRKTAPGITYTYPVGTETIYYPLDFIRGTSTTGTANLSVRCNDGTKNPYNLVDSVCRIDQSHYYTIGNFSKAGIDDTLKFFSNYTWNRAAYYNGSRWFLANTSDSITSAPYHIGHWGPTYGKDYAIAQYKNQGISDTNQVFCQGLDGYQVKTEKNIPGTKIVFSISPVKEGGATITPDGLFTPADTGTYKISITGDDCFIKNSVTFKVILNPDVTITPNSDTTCYGISKTFSTTAVNGDSFKYLWQISEDKQTYNDITLQDSIPVYTTPADLDAGTHFYRVLTTNNAGCSAYSDTASLTVFSNPIIEFTKPIASDTTVCEAQNVLFETEVSVGNTFTYQWQKKQLTDSLWTDFPNNVGNYMLSADDTNFYRVVVANENACKDTTRVILVNVLPNPKVVVTPTESMSCINDNLTISSMVTEGNTFTYNWKNSPDSLVFTDMPEVTPSINTGILTATVYYQLTVTNENGCYTTPPVIPVWVHENPVVHLVTPINDTTVCEDRPVLFTAESTGGNSFTYQWQRSLNNITYENITAVALAENIYTANPDTTALYRVMSINNFGCDSPSDSLKITVNQKPDIAITPNAAKSCIYKSDTLYATADNDVLLQWAPTADLTDILSTSDTLAVSPMVTTSYTLTGTDNIGCQAFLDVVVTKDTLPVIVITSSNHPGFDMCPGDTINMTAKGAATYVWEPTTGDKLYTSTVHIPLEETTAYTIYAVNGNGCKDTTDLTVTINLKPISVINLPQLDTMVCEDNNFEMSALATSGTAFTYQWQKSTDGVSSWSDIESAVNVNYDITVKDTLYYRHITKNEYQCIDTSDILKVNVLYHPVLTMEVSDSEICKNDSTLLTVHATKGQSYIYQWQKSTDNLNYTDIVNATDSTLNTGGLSDGMYFRAMVASENGCTAIPSEVAYVTVRPNPIIDILATGSDTTICAHYPFMLHTSITGGDSFTYQWQKSTDDITYTNIADATTTSYGEKPEVSTSYRIVVTNNFTCIDSNAIFKVNTWENQPVVSNVNDTSVCYGKEVHLLLSGADSYNWTPSTYLSSATSDNVTAIPLTDQKYIITGEHLNGCKITDSIHLGVYSLPVITVTPPAISVFKGDTAYLAAQGAVTYQWNPTDSLMTDFGETVKAFAQTTRTYTVTGTDIHGCIEDTTVKVTVYPRPIITIVTPNTQDTSVCEDNLVKFEVHVSGGDSYVYQWQESLSGTGNWTNIATANESIFMLTVQKNAFYRVQVYNNFSANDSSDVYKVNMIPKPIVNVSIQDPAICSGETNRLTSTYSIGNTFTYQWLNSTDNITYNNIPAQTQDFLETGVLDTTTYFKLRVTNENNCATLSEAATVIVHPNPHIVPSVTDTTICANNPLTISTKTSGGNTYTYQWQTSSDKITFTDITSATADTLSLIPTDTIFYRLYAENDFTCHANGPVISVYPIDNPIITITPEEVKSCRLSPDTLTAFGGVSYEWSPAEGLNKTTGATVIATVAANTTYTVSSIGANGCKSSASVLLKKDTIPVISISKLSGIICEKSSTQLTAEGAETYSWHPAASLDVANAQVVNASPMVTTTYTAIGKDNNGCIDSSTVSIVVNERPKISITYPTKDSSVCLNQPVSLRSNIIGVSPFNYQWQESTDGTQWQNIAGATLSDYHFEAATVKYYRVVASNRYDCLDTSAPRKIELNIQSSLDIVPDKTFLCSGDNTTLRIQIDGGTSFTYQWLASETGTADSYQNIAGATAATYATGNLTQTKFYKVRITNNEGCMSLSEANQMTVYNNPNVIIKTPQHDTTICQADTILLAAEGALNYNWSPNIELLSSDKDKVYAYPSDTITYYVVGTDEHGCINKDTITIRVNQRPIVTVDPVATTICKNAFTYLKAYGGVSYHWYPYDGLNFANRQTVIAEPTSTITYTVTGTDANGCSNTAQTTVTVIPFEEVVIEVPDQTCETTDSIFLKASMTGGEWIGEGIINASLGIFSPSLVGPGKHPISYKNTTFCPSSDSIFVNVVALNKPTITTVVPEHQCLDSYIQTVDLQATPIGGNWTDNGTTINPKRFMVYPGENQIIYALSGFCTSSDTLNTHAHPIDTATVLTTQTDYCSETNLVKLIAKSTQDEGGLWSGYKINPSTGVVNLADVYSGKYTYVFTPTYCPASDSITITVYPSITPSIVTPSSELCFNQTLTMDATPAGGYWTVNGQQIASNVFVPYQHGSYEITYQMYQNCAHADTIHIFVKDTIPTNILSGYSDTICRSNTPITFNIKGYDVFYAVDHEILPQGIYYPTKLGNHILNYYIYGSDSICQMSENKTFRIIDTIPSQILTQENVFCSNSQPFKFEAFPAQGLWYGEGMNVNGYFNPQHKSGTYTILFNPSTKCTLPSNTSVTVIESPEIKVSVTEESCHQKNDAQISVKATGNGPFHYLWEHTPADTNLLTRLAAGDYYLTVYSNPICPTYDTISIANNPEYCNHEIFIPNVFYPYSQTYENSIIRVYGKGFSEFIFIIYDRYGHIVFKTRDQKEFWDGTNQGKLMEAGVYHYTFEALMYNGETYQMKGNITLIK